MGGDGGRLMNGTDGSVSDGQHHYCVFCAGDDGQLVEAPCQCTTRMHTACLQQWITSEQRRRNMQVGHLQCEVCRHEYSGVSSAEHFQCRCDDAVCIRNSLRTCCILLCSAAMMVYGLQSVFYDNGEGLGANLFLPLAMALLCVGLLNCAEGLHRYLAKHTQETLCYQGIPMKPDVELTAVNSRQPARASYGTLGRATEPYEDGDSFTGFMLEADSN